MSEQAIRDILSPSERERVLRAMARICAERGYEATTVAEVAAEAGVEEDVFAEMFGNKEQCMLAVIDAAASETIAAVSTAYKPDRSPWDSAVFGIKAILEMMAANPSLAYVSYIAARQMAPPGVARAREAGVRILAAMMNRTRAYSDTSQQPPAAALAALGGAEAVVRREISAGRTEQLPRLLPDLAYGAAIPFLGQEEAMRLAETGRRALRGTRWE